jgi:hypothetical protein
MNVWRCTQCGADVNDQAVVVIAWKGKIRLSHQVPYEYWPGHEKMKSCGPVRLVKNEDADD